MKGNYIMRRSIIATGLLIATGAGAAMAQIAGGTTPRPLDQVQVGSVQVGPELKQMIEVQRLTKEVDRLNGLTAALETRLAAVETKAGTTLSRLDTLQYHFENHQHTLRGYLGSGISSAYDGKGKAITYMTPFSNDAENKNASVTNPPMK